MKCNLNIILFCISLIALPFVGSAQGFERIYPVSGDQSHGNTIAKCLDGGFLLVGTVGPRFQSATPRILKIDAEGSIQWSTALDGLPGVQQVPSAVYASADGTFYIAGRITTPNKVFLCQLNGAGQLLWTSIYDDDENQYATYSQVEIQPVSVGGTADPANGFYLFWNIENGSIRGLRTDAQGFTVWYRGYPQVIFAPGHRFTMKIQADDRILVTGRTETLTVNSTTIDQDGNQLGTNIINVPSSVADIPGLKWHSDGALYTGSWHFTNQNISHFAVTKYSANGSVLWNSIVYDQQIIFWGWDARFAEMDNGDMLVSFNFGLDQYPDNFAVPVIRISPTGQVLWTKYFVPVQESVNYNSYDFVALPNGEFAGINSRLSGETASDSMSIFFLKASADGRSHLGTIHGRVMKDYDQNCLDVPQEAALKNLPILATGPNNKKFYATSDINGNYTMDVDTGGYVVTVSSPSAFWVACQNNINALLTATNDSAQVDFPIQATSLCPQLDVQVSTNRFRPCLDSDWVISFCNGGTQDATGAYIIVELDSLIDFVSSSTPFTLLGDHTVQFDIGEIPSLECGEITFKTTTDCAAQIGQSLCAEAHIYPDSICGDTLGERAMLVVKGKCVGNGSALFTVKNIGTKDMTEAAEFIVIEDDMIQYNSSGQVPPLFVNETYAILATGLGSTFRIELEQADNNPAWSQPSATVEGCNTNINWGFLNMFPPDDAAEFFDVFCLEVVNSFDPNDKNAFPKGIGQDHFLEKNTDLEYTIRFQNTGTDVAYLVVIRDTLDKSLDPTGIHMGASSHPYTWELVGQGILKVTYADINLPDSNANEAASHGFISFRIPQQKDLSDGTIITNKAGIYFDSNEPVITNEVWHKIGRPLVSVTFDPSNSPAAAVKVTPNPFSETADINLSSAPTGSKLFALMDLSGKMIQSQSFEGDRFSVSSNGLIEGMYFFSISGPQGYRVTGKLMVK